jgi:hypothetical protein
MLHCDKEALQSPSHRLALLKLVYVYLLHPTLTCDIVKYIGPFVVFARNGYYGFPLIQSADFETLVAVLYQHVQEFRQQQQQSFLSHLLATIVGVASQEHLTQIAGLLFGQHDNVDDLQIALENWFTTCRK